MCNIYNNKAFVFKMGKSDDIKRPKIGYTK